MAPTISLFKKCTHILALVLYVTPCVNAVFVCGLQVGVPFRLDLEEAYLNKSQSLETLVPLSGGIVLRYQSHALHGLKQVS